MSAPRVALITGAAQGIGESIALRLADDGLDVAVNDIPSKSDQLASVVKAIEAKGRRAVAVPGDVSSETDTITMVDKTVEILGGLNVMVANAGFMIMGPLVEMDVSEWDRIMSINVRGVMLSYKYAARQMIKQDRGGRIIGAASVAAKRGAPNGSAYCASKFAVRGLTQSAAQELAEHKITVNAYAPGCILTPMIHHPDDEKNGGPGSTTLKASGLQALSPADPSVIAALVSYLINPEAYFVTGQTINVDGGVFFD